MSKDDLLWAFLAGLLAGTALSWSVAKAGERFRRVRYELRAARKGIKTLRKMLRREGATLVKVGAVVVLIVVAAVVVATRG